MAQRSSKCRAACEARTTASSGFCQQCKSLRHHGYKRIKAENLILDQAGGSWWIWNPRGDVLVSGKPSAADAAIALARGASNEDEDDDLPLHTSSHATRKTKAQLDREIAEFIAHREQAQPAPAGTSAQRDASRLRNLWTKHVSFDTRGIDVDRLHDVIRREVQVVKKGLATRRPEASRGLLTELRNDLATVGRIRNRRR